MFHSQKYRIEENTDGDQSLEDGAGDQLGEKLVRPVEPVVFLLVTGEDVVPGRVVLLLFTTGNPAVTQPLTPADTRRLSLS